MYRYAFSILSLLFIGWNVCSAATNGSLYPPNEGGGILILY